jgi:cytochrome c biogenesis protein CcdA
MIPAFIEGVAQSPLPCSWVVLVPAVLIGVSTPRVWALVSFATSVALTAWVTVAGWLVPPLWIAGLAMVIGAFWWWRYGLWIAPAIAVGAGAAWAWQPCVGEELAKALNTAQIDPWAALPSLAAFMIGVVVVGLAIGQLLRKILQSRFGDRLDRVAEAVVAILGLSMVVGLYTPVASVLARWSTSWWS